MKLARQPSTPAIAFSHSELCALGVKWMSRAKSQSGPGCLFSLSETRSGYTGEAPDVIGWRVAYGPQAGFDSVLIECKTSLADFRADEKKPFRIDAAKGMGVYRYYLAPEGLLTVDMIPEKWGLIQVNARGHLKVLSGHALARYSDEHLWRFETNLSAEHTLMCAALCRVSDPQKVQAQIREKNNTISRLTKVLEQERRAREAAESRAIQTSFGYSR